MRMEGNAVPVFHLLTEREVSIVVGNFDCTGECIAARNDALTSQCIVYLIGKRLCDQR